MSFLRAHSGDEAEERMHQETDFSFYRFRFVFAGIFTVAFLLLISALITFFGAGTVLAKKYAPTPTSWDVSMANDSNAVTSSLYKIVAGSKRITYTAGNNLYKDSAAVTAATVQTGKAIGHGSIAAIHGVGSGIAFGVRGIAAGTMFTLRTGGNAVMFVARTTGSAAMFTLRLPGKTLSPIAHASHADAIIHPEAESQVPVIDTKISVAMLAKLQVQAQADQQKTSEAVAAQLAANQHLSGVEVAGDASHGGYPAAWDAPTGQDSRLDSWGMYNRECVSYTAWKVYQTYGYMPYWGGVGNANQWVADAKNANIPTSSTPKVGSVAISMSGYYGHAMWVEAVSGNMIYVSQYNYDLHGHYSEMWVDGSSFTYIYFN